MDKKTDTFNPNQFKPMTEGLGLNHFADGLPYTPAHLRKRPMTQFNFPNSERQTVSQPPAFDSTQSVYTENARANFLQRSLAFALDVFFSSLIFMTIVWVSFSVNGFDIAALLRQSSGTQIFLPLALLYAVVYFGYFLIQEVSWRRTLGKALVGIRIQTNSGFSTLGRSICFFISAIPFGVGLFWHFFDSRGRCWHDVITDSEVVAG